jgi:hypothetical protein
MKIERLSARSGAFLLLTLFGRESAPAQRYDISRHDTLPPATIVPGTHALPIPAGREDVKAACMGKSAAASARTFNGMLYNPALLHREKLSGKDDGRRLHLRSQRSGDVVG